LGRNQVCEEGYIYDSLKRVCSECDYNNGWFKFPAEDNIYGYICKKCVSGEIRDRPAVKSVDWGIECKLASST
jgi:hypothetical protein